MSVRSSDKYPNFWLKFKKRCINGGPNALPQGTMDKINQWLQNGDVEHMKEFVHEGYGQHLVGKTSWNEDVRQYLKTLPMHLMSLGSTFHAVERGDVVALDNQLANDESLLRTKNSDGSTLIHHAVQHDQLDVLNYFLSNYPSVLNLKDRNGRTPLHIAGQQKNEYIYQVLSAAGADPMTLDVKGRSAEFYMSSSNKQSIKHQISPHSLTPENDSSGEKTSSTPENNPEDKQENEAEEGKGEDVEAKQEGGTNEQDKKDKESEKIETGATPPPDEPEQEEAEMEAKSPKPEDDSKEDDPEENKENQEDNNKEPNQSVAEEEKEKVEDNTLKVEKEKEEERRSAASSRTSESMVNSSADRLNELIDVWIRDKDLLRLEHVVIAGQGDRLIGRTSDYRQVQEFLELVPTYMARIRGVHEAVIRGNLGEVESVLTRKRFALSRDHLGASPLHLAVLHGHTDVVKYIIDNFPEALDGPDNEGRTPLHYAAVMRDGGNYYRILLMSGADETAVDKANHTPDYYLTHTGELTIRDLLEGYRIKEQIRRPSQVNIWQRPPTDEATRRGPFEEEEFDPFTEPEPGNTPNFSDSTSSGNEPAEQEDQQAEFLEETEGNSSPVKAERLQENEAEQGQGNEGAQNPLEVVEEDADEFDDEDEGDDFSLEFEDHTKMKDEEGQTVLHFASARVHPDGSFYALLSHAEVLIAERDAQYRTCRDVADESGQQENYSTIDRFVFDAFLQDRVSLVHMLLHEGYDHLIHINDSVGRDLASVLQEERPSAISLLGEVADFIKKREELHGYIRKSYLEGVSRLVKSDNTLVTAKSTRARCALHIAVLFEHMGVINALVKANSSAVHVADNLGRTPLHYAMATGNVDKIAKVLVKAGALRTTKDVRMRTPSYFFIYNDEIRRLNEEELRLA